MFSLATDGAGVLHAFVLGPGGDTLAGIPLGSADRLQTGRLAVASTTHLAYIQALGRLGNVAGVAHRTRLAPALKASPWAKGVAEIATATGLDAEVLLRLAPDALLVPPFSIAGRHALPGVRIIPVTEYLEEHPLGRAEWIRFFGALFGQLARADSLYNTIEARYNEVAARSKGPARPLVFFGSAWQGQWHAPPGNSHFARLIADAGGRYALADRTGDGNIPLDIETVVDLARRVDRFGAILEAPAPVNAFVLAHGDPRLEVMPSVRSGGFVANSAEADLFGQAMLEPDVLLLDLHCILHPGECAGRDPVYLRPVPQ